MTTKRFAISLALLLPCLAVANEEVEKLSADANNWAMWGGNYAGTRYSELTQIDKNNVARLQVAWTFSTGVLRGLGDTRTPMLWNLVGHWLIGLPLGYSLCFVLGLGVIGLWWGLSTGLIICGVSLFTVWMRKIGSVRL